MKHSVASSLFLAVIFCLLPPLAHAAKTASAPKSAKSAVHASSLDMAEVKRVWTVWINALRTRQKTGLKPYTYSPILDRTATAWSQQAADKGSISHKRPGQKSYYDYTLMKKWFASQGVTFPGAKGTAFTETIGWGVYSCSEKDCTQKLISSIKTTFDMYVKEKGKKSRPHWNSLVSAQFTQIGVGIAINPKKKQYFITTHYAVQAQSDR